MKKLIAVLTVALMANVAMAGPGFDILGTDPIQVPEGGTVDILIATDGGQSGGMSLYLQAIGGFDIVALAGADFEGSHWKVGGTATYEQVDIYPYGMMGPAAYGVATVGSPTNVTLPADAVLAKVTISANGLLAGAEGSLTTNTDVATSSLALDGVTGQDTIGLVVVPEPVTALLLLGGLPLIRRRRA